MGKMSVMVIKNDPCPPNAAQIKNHSCIERNGHVTHVIVPVDEYEGLVKASMVDSAIAKLEDKKAKWIDADQLGLELAGQRIAQARKAKNMTQAQLGKKLKLPQSQISRIECNPDQTTIRTLKKIAKALGVDVSALV